MHDNYKIMYAYRFFFLEDKVVWRRLPKVKTQLLQFFAMTRTRIGQVVDGYIKHGLFREEVSAYQKSYLLDQFMFSITSWLHAVDYMEIVHDPSAHYAKYTFSIWLPYLVPSEANEWEKLLTSVGGTTYCKAPNGTGDSSKIGGPPGKEVRVLDIL